MGNQLIDFLKGFDQFRGEDAELIAAATESRVYHEGDYLFKAEKICRELFFVCKGVLRIMVINEQAQEVTHFFLKENQFCSILNSFNNRVIATESIQAACDAEVLVLSRKNLDQLYIQIPYLKELITQITHQSLLDKIALRNSYLGHDSTGRYKLFLSQQPLVASQVQLSDVASYLGITPQSLSRIRKNIR
ncbi:Crp/Fnr family transcriptional regulator [Mucilaginibacter sp.]